MPLIFKSYEYKNYYIVIQLANSHYIATIYFPARDEKSSVFVGKVVRRMRRSYVDDLEQKVTAWIDKRVSKS